jgi:ABC-type lipoprotein release transport system permease subunit
VAYSIVIAVLLTTAMIAAWLPARRAVRVDPATMLRAQ